jgi:hypothetical protein
MTSRVANPSSVKPEGSGTLAAIPSLPTTIGLLDGPNLNVLEAHEDFVAGMDLQADVTD